MTKLQLDTLRSRIGHHEAEAKRLSRELHEGRLAYLGLVPGETVIVDAKGEEYLFQNADGHRFAHSGHRFWSVQGNPRLKSGDWSKALRNVCYWEVKPCQGTNKSKTCG